MTIIERTAHAEAGFIQNMGIDHGGGEVFMAEQFLDGADIVAVLEQMGGEAMAKGVAAGRFRNASRANGKFDRVLEVFL